MTTIIGLSVSNKIEETEKLQKILLKHGCSINVRLCLQNMGEFRCEKSKIVLLEVINNSNDIYDDLSKNWDIQTMKFD